jgi:hypothetical protein
MTTPLPENCVPLLCQAAELGLKLGVKDSRTLTVEPAERCPSEFADALRAHKWQLLVVLGLPFVMVYSKAIEETIFFCADEDTKAALVNPPKSGTKPLHTLLTATAQAQKRTTKVVRLKSH